MALEHFTVNAIDGADAFELLCDLCDWEHRDTVTTLLELIKVANRHWSAAHDEELREALRKGPPPPLDEATRRRNRQNIIDSLTKAQHA